MLAGPNEGCCKSLREGRNPKAAILTWLNQNQTKQRKTAEYAKYAEGFAAMKVLRVFRVFRG
jgi:hypothetical protein